MGVPTIRTQQDLAGYRGRTILVVVPHADDPALFCGGLVAALARAGARLVMVRVTRDDTDAFGMTAQEATEQNAADLARAARVLGIGTVVDLGYDSDRLAEVPETQLRERLIREIRRHRPYAVLGFDPFSILGEDNQDHLRVAQALDEAYWTSMFDLHHPEHMVAGLTPHGVVERWYFGRRLVEVTDVLVLGENLSKRVAATGEHRAMVVHLVNQLALMARTEGRELPGLAQALADPRPLVTRFTQLAATSCGQRHGVGPAEEYRVVRYAGLESLVDMLESDPEPRPQPEKENLT